MATTAWKSAGTATVLSDGSVPWDNASNITSENGTVASATAGGVSSLATCTLRATNFGFTTGDVPNGSVINGVEMQFKKRITFPFTASAVRDFLVQLYVSGALGPDNKAVPTDWPTTLTFSTYGSATSLWGATVADTDVRASTFGVNLQAVLFLSHTTVSAEIDVVQIRVHYTGSGGVPSTTPSRAVLYLATAAQVVPGWSPLLRLATEYTDTPTRPYAGRLLTAPEIRRQTVGDRAVGSGVEQGETTLDLRNTDGELLQYFARGMSGWTVRLLPYDVRVGTVDAAIFTGHVEQTAMLPDGTIRLVAVDFDRTALERDVPSVLVGTDTFPNAVSVGAVVPAILGAAHIIMPYVCAGAGGHYDYLVGHGVITVASVRRVVEGGKEKTPSTVTIASSLYSILTSAYAGYTVVRFAARQTNGTGDGDATLVADVIGPTETSALAGAIRAVLHDPAWGCDQPVDEEAFVAAQDALNAATGAQLVVAGALVDRSPARDILDDLLAMWGLRLSLDSTRRWVLTVPTVATEPVAHLRIESGLRTPGTIEHLPLPDVARLVRLRYRPDVVQGHQATRALVRDWSAHTPAGQTIEWENPYIDDDVTADVVLDRRAKRLFLEQETIRGVVVSLAVGRLLSEGSLVLYTWAPAGLVAAPYRVRAIEHRIDGATADLVPYHPMVDAYTPSTFPPENLIPDAPIEGEVDTVTFGPDTSGTQVAIDDAYHEIGTLAISVAAGNRLETHGNVDVTVNSFTGGTYSGQAISISLRVRDITSGLSAEVTEPGRNGVATYALTTTLTQTGVSAGTHTVKLELRGNSGSGYGWALRAYMRASETPP